MRRRLNATDAARILLALERFASAGTGDVKALKGRLRGRYRLRVGKWRIFFSLDQPGTILVIALDNRGQAY